MFLSNHACYCVETTLMQARGEAGTLVRRSFQKSREKMVVLGLEWGQRSRMKWVNSEESVGPAVCMRWGTRERKTTRVTLRFLDWSLGGQLRWERIGFGGGQGKDLLGLRCL